jgi:nucleotide-binding universal stress UspA family protein
MKNSTILIVIGVDTPANTLATKLEAIRAIPAHASILIFNEMPVISYYAMGITPYSIPVMPLEWHDQITAGKAALEEKANEVETLLAQHDVSDDVSTIACDPAVAADSIARHAMLCDMTWISEDLRAAEPLFRQIAYGILFQSPVGVLLNDASAKAISNPDQVFVAWNTQLQSARAVHQALPILRGAKNIIIGSVDPIKTERRDGEDPGIDVAKWLTHHGCNVTVNQYPSDGQDVATSILKAAKGVDLIVMGAYGHSRAREAVFGGTTRALIEQTDQAVFLAH